ncbi:MAG: hypothetical protein E6G60_02430, partial [Actinobacteria bacterium]
MTGPLPEPAPATASDGKTSDSDEDAQSEAPGARPMLTTRLVLVRHAVTAQTGPLLSGRTPGIDLSEDGQRQAAAVAERLADLPVVAVYASPMERTTRPPRRSRHGTDCRSRPSRVSSKPTTASGQVGSSGSSPRPISGRSSSARPRALVSPVASRWRPCNLGWSRRSTTSSRGTRVSWWSSCRMPIRSRRPSRTTP